MTGQESEEEFVSLGVDFLDKYGDLDGRISGWFETDRGDAWAEYCTKMFPTMYCTSRAESSHAALKAHFSGLLLLIVWLEL